MISQSPFRAVSYLVCTETWHPCLFSSVGAAPAGSRYCGDGDLGIDVTAIDFGKYLQDGFCLITAPVSAILSQLGH